MPPIKWIQCTVCSEPDIPSKNGIAICLNESCPTNILDTIYDKRVVLTGTFYGKRQKDLERLIIDNGGSVHANISKQIDYLVLGAPVHAGYKSEKERKAIRVGVSIISQEELEEILAVS